MCFCAVNLLVEMERDLIARTERVSPFQSISRGNIVEFAVFCELEIELAFPNFLTFDGAFFAAPFRALDLAVVVRTTATNAAQCRHQQDPQHRTKRLHCCSP